MDELSIKQCSNKNMFQKFGCLIQVLCLQKTLQQWQNLLELERLRFRSWEGLVLVVTALHADGIVHDGKSLQCISLHHARHGPQEST